MDMRWCRSRYPGGVADEAEDSGIIGVLFDNCLGFESIVFQNPGGFFAECSLKSDLKRRIGWQQSWRSHRRSKSGNSAQPGSEVIYSHRKEKHNGQQRQNQRDDAEELQRLVTAVQAKDRPQHLDPVRIGV